jgi:hypothetical protein
MVPPLQKTFEIGEGFRPEEKEGLPKSFPFIILSIPLSSLLSDDGIREPSFCPSPPGDPSI